MSTLKVIKNRIKSVTNTKKITQSMRLVSAAKYARAERELQNARPLGQGSKLFYDHAEVSPPGEIESQLFISLTSDRGLCGGIHSGIARAIRQVFRADPAMANKTKIICVGDKSRAILSKMYPEKMLWVATEIGRKPIAFLEASKIAEQIRATVIEHNFSTTKVYYNQFESALTYKAETVDIHNKNAIYAGKKFHVYDEIDEDIIDSFIEFSLAAMVFWMMKEGAASEHGARMTAMEAATRNAGEMINALTLQFNRTRQAVITRELIEIISGANALEES